MPGWERYPGDTPLKLREEGEGVGIMGGSNQEGDIEQAIK